MHLQRVMHADPPVTWLHAGSPSSPTTVRYLFTPPQSPAQFSHPCSLLSCPSHFRTLGLKHDITQALHHAPKITAEGVRSVITFPSTVKGTLTIAGPGRGSGMIDFSMYEGTQPEAKGGRKGQ